MEDAELESVKIQKNWGGKSHSRYPNSKSQYPSPRPDDRPTKEECVVINPSIRPGISLMADYTGPPEG